MNILSNESMYEKYIKSYGLNIEENISLIEPIGYLDMINLEMNVEKIVTDSGEMQKETFL